MLAYTYFLLNTMKKYNDVVFATQQWIASHRPDASIYHKAAFVNSVAYYCTGISQGSGPSIREHICSWALVGDGSVSSIDGLTLLFPDNRLPSPGQWSLERAITFCDPICFGPLPQIALKVAQQEHCFDDDPHDLFLLSSWKNS